MKRVFIFRRSDDQQVYDYGGPLVEMSLFPFDEYYYSEIDVPDPAEPPVIRERKVWEKLDFLRRISQDERIAVRARRMTDPFVDDFMALLDVAATCANDDPDLLSGMNYLTQLGIITPARLDQILYG